MENECISFQSPFLVQCHVNDGKIWLRKIMQWKKAQFIFQMRNEINWNIFDEIIKKKKKNK